MHEVGIAVKRATTVSPISFFTIIRILSVIRFDVVVKYARTVDLQKSKCDIFLLICLRPTILVVNSGKTIFVFLSLKI